MIPNLSLECTAVPAFPYTDTREYSVETIYYEDDASQAIVTSATEHREINNRYETQTDAQRASFISFVNTQMTTNWSVWKGVFFWNDPRTGEKDIKVRFKDWKFQYQCDGPTVWSWGAVLVRVLS